MTQPSQTPLGVNVQADFLKNVGLRINAVAQSYMGQSKVNGQYTPGSIVNNTCLKPLTYAIHDAYCRGVVYTTVGLTYDNLIKIGQNVCEILGNSKPRTFNGINESDTQIPADVPTWYHDGYPATTGYAITSTGYSSAGSVVTSNVNGQGQEAAWLPYTMSNTNNSITQWGFVRCFALQAWNEFNWNGGNKASGGSPLIDVEYRHFLMSFMSCSSFADFNNKSSVAVQKAPSFLQGIYSNMNDLTSADILGVSLSKNFGTDCITAGKVIDLSKIDKFGLPSVLLQTIYKNYAMTQSLNLALLSADLLPEEILSICNQSIEYVTKDQEQKIYGAFLVIVGSDLLDIMVPLNCKIKNLLSLADLLDLKKLFPNSYQSLTVPIYNTRKGPTNSKTYYPIYENNSVSSRINTPAIQAQIGTIVIPGTPPQVSKIDVTTTTSTTTLSNNNFQELPKGLGSYLSGIIPEDIALAAGAFSMAMQQVKNIKNITFEKFAQVAASIEVTNANLPLVNGTDVPTNTTSASTGGKILSLGSGPYGTYTMSDFFGCASGLPYNWRELEKYVRTTQTTRLKNIYEELFLAVTWEAASVTVNTETRSVEISPGVFQTEYRVSSFSVSNDGGGYGRGTAVDPIITASNGGSGTGVVGRNASALGSVGNGTYGRVNSTTTTNQGSWVLSPPTATIQCPPTATLPVNSSGSKATGGTNTASGTVGWPSMNSIVQSYIDQANQEIIDIRNSRTRDVELLNTIYNYFGTQLQIEQSARFQAMNPVPVPRDRYMAQYPTGITNFIDVVGLTYAKATRPHMESQTLEAMTNLQTVGGQSLIALMRQERNKDRLNKLPIPLDNQIPSTLSEEEQATLTSNGTIKLAVGSQGIKPYVDPKRTKSTDVYIFTSPSSLVQEAPPGLTQNNLISSKPSGFFNKYKKQFIKTPKTSGLDNADPINRIFSSTPVANIIPKNIKNFGEISPELEDSDTFISALAFLGVISPDIVTAGAEVPEGIGESLDNGSPLTSDELAQTSLNYPYNFATGGTPNIPSGANINTAFLGSLSGSPFQDFVDPELDVNYTASTLLPNQLTTEEAINQVIECNCDCWVD